MHTQKNALLKDYSYYGTGGPCAVLYVPADVQELSDSVRDARRRELPLFLLGGGTNSLVMDEPFEGAFIVFKSLTGLRREGLRMIGGAGIDNSRVAQLALAQGLTGAEWMNRLPGQLGGTVRMNARCYGGEISQVVTKVVAVTRTGEIREYTDRGMFQGYKDTIFMRNGDLIAGAELTLAPGDAAAIEAKMRFCESDRVAKGQFDWPSCGCVFKNDYAIGVPSGMLLEAAGAKGIKHGGAEVSPHHANFVYNKGASSRAILELTLDLRDRVYQMFGAWLEYEMEILGRVPADLAARLAETRPQRLDQAALAPLKEKMAKRD